VARSALVVLVAAAEPLVATHRFVHDPMASRGVPAHVTVLHPFRDVVDESTAQVVESIAGEINSFTATFASVGRFPGEVVFLSPEPLGCFKAMTQMFVQAFPDCPPYGGAFPDPHPHLTVATRIDESIANRIEAAVTPGLPVVAPVDQLTLLIEDDDGMWSVGTSWPLRDATNG
jgi:2'-5' RNA ligase